MKTIFFHEINFLNIFIIFIFRIIGFKIFFIKISNKLRNKFFIQYIKSFGLEWYNYQTCDYQNPHSNILIPANNLSNIYSKEITDLVWNKDLESFLLEKQNLNICLHQRYMKNFEALCEVYAIAKHYAKNNKKIYLWLPNNSLSREVIKRDSRVTNLCPRSFTFLNIFFYYSFKFIYLFIIKKFSKKIISLTQFNKINNKFSKKNISDFKVCFFPQGGLDNGMWKKNYYYSENKNNPFHFSNIIHFEWSKDDPSFIVNNNRTLAFYKEKNIEFIFWDNIKSKINSFNYKVIFLFMNILFSLYKKIDLSNILEIFVILFQVKEHKKKLSNFSNLKVAFIGYDSNFPQSAAVACRLSQIILVAAQERTIEPARGYQYLLDKYFIIGEQSKKILENRIDKKMQLIETGSVKMQQNLNGEEIKILHENYFKLKCLVMDFSSVEDWYNNGRYFAVNWKKNLNFYKNIYNLAKKNKEILFLIKGKDCLWLKIDFFKKMVEDFNNLKNVKILSDLKKWIPSNCIKSTDFGIAMMTSLADEMIASDKPVIIFEPEDFPSCLLDYGPTIISKNFEDLNIKVNEIKSNLKFYNSKLNPLRNRFYKKFNREYFFSQIQQLRLNF